MGVNLIEMFSICTQFTLKTTLTYFWSKVYNQPYVVLIIILLDFFKEGDSYKREQKKLTAAKLLQLQRSEVILDTNKNYRGYPGHKQKLRKVILDTDKN